jgi:5-methylcytosine-specific restriction protein A
MKITLSMSKAAYPIAQKVHLGNLSRTQGVVKISEQTGMAEGSAGAFITIFLAMLSGETYKRAFNNDTNRFLLERIRIDYGEEAFRKALKAVQGHINYYGTLGKGELTGLQSIVDELKSSK